MDMVAVGMIALIANGALWVIYLLLACSGRDPETADELCRRPFLNFLIVGIGHMIPLFGLWLGSQRKPDSADWGLMVQVAIGLAILLGVLLQKKAIVLDAALMKKISIATADG